MNRVVITGAGLICPLGSSVNSVWSRILSGDCATASLPSEYDSLPCRIAASIDPKLYDYVRNTCLTANEKKTMSKSSVLMMHAAQEAMKQAQISEICVEDQNRCGVSVGLGFDGVQESIEANKFNAGLFPYSAVGPYVLTRSLGNMPCAHIGLRFKMKGPSRSVNTACAAGLHAIGDGFRTIQYGEADLMLAGGVDASITPWSIAAFSRIRALPTTFNDMPQKASRPFDSARSGFVMSEGAGAVVLESLDHAIRRGKQPLVEVVGFGQSCDTFSLVAPDSSGDGAYRAIMAALKDANLTPKQIDYVNAHATSTPQGDIIECRAIDKIFGRDVLVGSYKGSLGHCLGGSGAVETVLTVQSIIGGLIAPNTNLEDRDPDITVNLVPGNGRPLMWPRSDTRIAIKNSFGFGGTNCCLILKQYI